MIIEPVPTAPRSPVRRTLRVVGLAVPLVLLLAVVAVGTFGPRSEPAPSPDASGAAAGATAPATADPGAAEVPSERPPALVVEGTPVAFPSSWVGLRVRSVTEVLALRATGAADGILAVAGYFSYRGVPPACADVYIDLDRAACGGRTLLADVQATPSATGTTGLSGVGLSGIGPHLHPVFLPTTRGPAPDKAASDPEAEPIPVVVLGEFTDPAGATCPPDTRDCGLSFAIERVVWVSGKPWAPTFMIDPGMDVDRNGPEILAAVEDAASALGPGSLPLATAVVRAKDLETVDPVAAAAVPPVAHGRELRPITYARGLVFQFDASQPLYGRDPVVGWVVLDSQTGELLARGGPKSQPKTTEPTTATP